MDEAALCERIALIQNGKIMSIDTPEGIIETYPKPLFAIKGKPMSTLLQELRNSNLVDSAFSFGEFHHITLQNGVLPEQLKQSFEQQFPSIQIESIQPGIEDCFIQQSLEQNEVEL